MCGRVSIAVDYDTMHDYLYDNYEITTLNKAIILPRYNVAPGQNLLTMIHDGNEYRVGLIKWGFVPSFNNDEQSSFKMINAKAETIDKKPSFKESFKYKRCAILVDGFYEWKKENNQKIPIRIHMKDHKIFTLAGIYSTYISKDQTKHHTCLIITTQANEMMSPIHDRMPIILEHKELEAWLNPKNINPSELSKLLVPYRSDNMHAYQVSNFVNNPRNETSECIVEVR